MWSFTALDAVGPELRAIQEVLTRVYPFVPRGILIWFVVVILSGIGGLHAAHLKLNEHHTSVLVRREDDLFSIMVASLQKLRQARSVMMTIENTESSDSNHENAIIKSEPDFGTNLYWDQWKTFWVTRGYVAGSGGDPREFLSVTTWNWSSEAMRDFFSHCIREQRNNEVAQIVIRQCKNDNWCPWSIRTLKPSRPLESVILLQEKKSDIIQDLEEFLRPKTRQWYNRHCYPYRRGRLYYGPPATGKTSMIFALAGHPKLGIYCVPINDPDTTQERLAEMFRDLPDPCMVLLEDIDALNAATTERGSSAYQPCRTFEFAGRRRLERRSASFYDNKSKN